MRQFLLNSALRLSRFRGGHRVVKAVRNFCYAPYQRRAANGILLELDPYEWAQLSLAEHGITEPQTMSLIQRLLAPGDICIDVGAHVGFVSLVARKAIGDGGRVIAIEPQPYNCERMLRNWELNGFSNLNLHVAVAGPQAGFVKLPQQSVTDKSRLSLSLPMPDALSLEYEVPMITLDNLIAKYELPNVKLVKIDVEGFELAVLQGLSENLKRVQNIIFEALDPNTGASTEKVCGWLAKRGFSIRTVTGEPWDDSNPIPESNLWATSSIRACRSQTEGDN